VKGEDRDAWSCRALLQSAVLIERDALRALIYTFPGRRGAKIGRVDVGAQEMTGNAGGRFDREDVFGGEAVALLNPFPDSRLPYSANAGQG
jgi:hypothetical protein